jgi:hypothetical protein
MVATGGAREPLAAVSTLHVGSLLTLTVALCGLLVTVAGLVTRGLLQRRAVLNGETA